MNKGPSNLNMDARGAYWDIKAHDRETLWRHMDSGQKVAATVLEKLGWTLYRVDREHFRHAYMSKPGEFNTTIARSA